MNRASRSRRWGRWWWLLFWVSGCVVDSVSGVDLVLPGSVQVDVTPPEAVADGARWFLDDGVGGQDSGGRVEGVTPGRHEIRFADLPGWKEPVLTEVLVVGGQMSRVAVAFLPVPRMPVDQVPDQNPRAGEKVEFFVEPGEGPVMEVGVVPTPVGAVSWEASSGKFSFAPATGDRSTFTVTFTRGGVVVGQFRVVPEPVLPSEEVVIQYDRALPDDESRDYMVISETSEVVPVFNDVPQARVLKVSISGKTLVFGADHSARLFQQYGGRENIQELHLYADRVVIRSVLKLPQTRVTIHARELRFEGDGQLDTTPRARVRQPAGAVWEDDRMAGVNGDEGHAGGDVDVFVERFHADPSSLARLVVRGGQGGPAGEGRHGRNEGDFPFLSADWNKLMSRAGNPVCGTTGGSSVIVYYVEFFNNKKVDECGSKVTARGESAVPSGAPGVGGRGGTVRSTVNLSGLVDQGGGTPGARGQDYVGGALLARKYIYRTARTTIRNGEEVTNNSDSNAPKENGRNATAPFGVAGATGALEMVSDGRVWLKAHSVRQILEFAKDAYLNGHLDVTRQLLTEYREALRGLQVIPGEGQEISEEEFAELTGLNQMALEMDTLLHRIESNLDFFGNPAGWVPMLSFEANLASFEREIDQSIPILYLAYWINQAATNQLNSLAAAQVAVGKLGTERLDLEAAYNEAQLAIPGLKVESENIRLRIGVLMGQLESLEKELLRRAEQNVEDRHKVPFWKKGLAVLGTVAQLVPVGQPIVGRVGSGLKLLSQFDPDKPVASAKALAPKAFDAFSAKDIRVCFTPPSTNATNSAMIRKERIKTLTECGKFLGQELKEVASVFKTAQVDSKEVESELEKLKASDPVFLETTTELQDLNVRKEEFALKLANSVQVLAGTTSALAENAMASVSLEDRIAAALTTLDHNALTHIRELERRAKDRLLKFQYYVAKAFQYRTLQPYRGSLQLARLFERFKTLVESGGNHLLNATDFQQLKTLYLAELRDIASQTASFLNANAPEQALPVRIALEPSEIAQLNGTNRAVTINLAKRVLFPTFHENIRIANLRTRAVVARPVGGSVGVNALMFLNFEHRGVSRLTSGAQTYLFRHYQTESVNPIAWNTVYDGVANNFNNSTLSVSSQSLLNVLLDDPDEESLQLFSRPAAGADIVIRKEVRTSNGIDLVIDQLELELEYEFDSTRPNQPALDVVVDGNLQPVVVVSRADLNGRRDGRGDFRRVYPAGTQITLTAPSTYGARPLERWIINGVMQPVGTASVTVPMSTATTAELRYRTVEEPLALRVVPATDGQMGFQFPTVSGVRYVIEQTAGVGVANWTAVETKTGDGSALKFTRPVGTARAVFFRVRTE